MKKTKKREIKYEALFQAALKVFAEYGFKKTTIEDIADELGVGKSSLYFYIEDKRDLYDKAVAYGFGLWQNRVREAVAAETDAARQFTVMAHKALEYLTNDKYLRNILKRDPSLFPLHPSKDPYSEINRASLDMLKAVLRRGIDSGVFREVDIDTTAPLLFSIYVLLIQKAYMFPEGDFSGALFESGIDLILRGLLSDRARKR